MSRFATALAALAAVLLLAACAEEPKEPEFPNPLLTRVPADTPYVLATGEPVSEAVNEAWAEQFEPAIDIARQQIEDVTAELEAENPELAAQVSAVVDEILALADKEEREKIGLTRDDRLVIYGQGLMPVLRMSVSDPEAFRGFLARLGNKSGVGMGATTFDGHEVSRLAVAPVVILGALEDGVLSVGVTTIDGERAMLEHLFSGDVRGDTLVDAGTMPALIEQYGFLSAGVGYLDMPGLLKAVIGDGEAPGLLEKFGAAPEELGPACRDELVSLAGMTPRLVFGYDELSESSMTMRSVLEVESAAAEAMAAWTVPVPGLGVGTDARYAFGMSLDGTKAAQTVKGWMNAAAERQFECGFLADTPWKESAAQINVAPLYMVGNPKGFMVRLHELEIRDIEARDFTASATAVAVFDNAQTLSGMVRMMAPPLQAMDLPTDGTPVQVPPEAVGELGQPVWLASTDKILAVALGEDAEARVAEVLDVEAPEPAPFLHFDFDAAWFYNMLADWMPQIARQAEQAADGNGGDGDNGGDDETAGDGDGLSAEELADIEKSAAMMRAYGDILGRMSYQIRLTGQGVEIVTTADLKK